MKNSQPVLKGQAFLHEVQFILFIPKQHADNQAKFSILRVCMQDVRHKISKIQDELYNLHLSLGKNFVNFDSSENKDYICLSSFNLTHQRNLDKKFLMLSKNKNHPKMFSTCILLTISLSTFLPII